MADPGLYPRRGPRPGAPPGERAVWQALSQHLPEGWFAWHSVRLRTRRGVEAETDFVLAIPDRGALVLEVKGGVVDIVDGVWTQGGRPMARAPRDQAHDFRRTLKTALEERGIRGVWIDIATMFPDTPFIDAPSNGDVHGSALGQQDLSYLDEALIELADRLFLAPGGGRVTVPRDPGWIDAIHDLWGECWVKASRLGDQRMLREHELVQLDAQQHALIDSFIDNPRVVVRGGPGTGKTLVAMEVARRFAKGGKRVQCLCFTRALAVALRAHGLEASTVREHAAHLVLRSGRVVAEGRPTAEWTTETWESIAALARECVPSGGIAEVDAWIVDEAQDFAESDRALVRTLAGDRPLWIFLDEGQAYWPDRLLVEPFGDGFAKFRLLKSYRTPEGLDRVAEQYRSGWSGTPMREPVRGLRLVAVESEALLDDAIAQVVGDAVRGGLAPADIAVLSLAGQGKTRVGALAQIAGLTARRADADDAEQYLVADTFLRFKGLERPLVVVTELSKGKKGYDVRMHIALTRANLECVVVATYEEIAADGRLMAVAEAVGAP
ncbi:MAG: NERD domain-containing protein [Polyangiales bacterium]